MVFQLPLSAKSGKNCSLSSASQLLCSAMANYSATALPGNHGYHQQQDAFLTALPKVSSKGKEKKSSSSLYDREFSTALPRAKLQQVKGHSYISGSPPPPARSDGPSQEPADHGHFTTALPRVKPLQGTYLPTAIPGGFATALPKVKETSNHTQSQRGSSPQRLNGRVEAAHRGASPFSNSPRSMRRSPNSNAQIIHNVKTIYTTFWGQGLTFNPYMHGDEPVSFPRLWPERRATLVEGFVQAELDKNPYELIKLLLATSSNATLEVLVEEKVRNR